MSEGSSVAVRDSYVDLLRMAFLIADILDENGRTSEAYDFLERLAYPTVHSPRVFHSTTCEMTFTKGPLQAETSAVCVAPSREDSCIRRSFKGCPRKCSKPRSRSCGVQRTKYNYSVMTESLQLLMITDHQRGYCTSQLSTKHPDIMCRSLNHDYVFHFKETSV